MTKASPAREPTGFAESNPDPQRQPTLSWADYDGCPCLRLIGVAPDQDFDLAVVFNGGNYGQGGVWGRWGQQIVGDRIIPAIAIAN